MPWATLGTVTPSFDWELFDQFVTDAELFRVSMTYDVPNPGKLVFASVFSSAETSEYITVYPNLEPQLFDSILSPAMQAYTNGTRYIKCKVTARSRLPLDLNWQVTLEAWS